MNEFIPTACYVYENGKRIERSYRSLAAELTETDRQELRAALQMAKGGVAFGPAYTFGRKHYGWPASESYMIDSLCHIADTAGITLI